jgi:hypothetical protein
MIISHRHRYLFVELPHTACTAISRELCQNYGGEAILRKHAYYHEFLRIASNEERSYFVFSGIRNPLDEAVSVYQKYRTNHRGNYTNPKKLRKHGGHVTQADLRRFRFIKATNADFAAFFARFYRRPYDNWSSLAHHRFDFVIRYERLQQAFAQVLASLGIAQKRPIPVVNPTADKSGFRSYYTPGIRNRTGWVFGPFMKKWGYAFPTRWGTVPVPLWSQGLFRGLAIYRNLRWRYGRSRSRPVETSLHG